MFLLISGYGSSNKERSLFHRKRCDGNSLFWKVLRNKSNIQLRQTDTDSFCTGRIYSHYNIYRTPEKSRNPRKLVRQYLIGIEIKSLHIRSSDLDQSTEVTLGRSTRLTANFIRDRLKAGQNLPFLSRSTFRSSEKYWKNSKFNQKLV